MLNVAGSFVNYYATLQGTVRELQDFKVLKQITFAHKHEAFS